MTPSQHPDFNHLTTVFPERLSKFSQQEVIEYKSAISSLYSKRDLSPQNVESLINAVRFYHGSTK